MIPADAGGHAWQELQGALAGEQMEIYTGSEMVNQYTEDFFCKAPGLHVCRVALGQAEGRGSAKRWDWIGRAKMGWWVGVVGQACVARRTPSFLRASWQCRMGSASQVDEAQHG